MNQALITPAIGGFHSMLEEADLELFMDTVEHACSAIEIWTLAVVLGYTGSIGELIRWTDAIHPRIDRRRILLSEAEQLQSDIANARSAMEDQTMAPEKGYQRITFLSRELRGHLGEVDKMSRQVDRRGLILAGADRVMRELRSIFTGSAEMESALGQSFKAVWAVLMDER